MRQRLLVVGVLVLCAVSAELLAAYGDSTGDPAGIAFAVVFFAALYGAPAILVRDVVRRHGWGWPSMLHLFAALGVAQACLIDQSLFSSDYMGYQGWEETREATLIPALGVSAYNAVTFILGHVIFSFGAPVAIAEAWRPQRAHSPWLGPIGTVLAILAYGGTAALVVADPESHSASPTQLLASAGVVVLLIAAAIIVGRRDTQPRIGMRRPAPRIPVWATALVAMATAFVSVLGGETWAGVALGVISTVALALGIVIAARHPDWSIRHIAAVGLGFLLARGLLAFTYDPLLGEVEPLPKYAHNTVMLLIVAAAGWLALRPASPSALRRPSHAADRHPTS